MTALASTSSLQPLLETLEDPTVPAGDLTDAHLTIVSRFTGEGSKQFAADVRECFPQLCKVFKTHVSSQNSALNNAALQALGFCVFNSTIAAELSETEVQDLLSLVSSVAVKTSDKNTRTRALWVISKQMFPPEIVGKEVSNIISTLETILTKGDVQSMVVEYEAANVIIRLMEQTPAQMGEEAVRWAKLIIPLVVHSAHKVKLRGATALEMGMPLLLQKQEEVAAVTEHLMTAKLISELRKLFSTKNETFVLKLWPLFIKLLGKTLHRSGSFINSLLQLEELGFRSGSPAVKKIAFLAWKSLIDNFALNPVDPNSDEVETKTFSRSYFGLCGLIGEKQYLRITEVLEKSSFKDILCGPKRLKLLMQPLSSIQVRTEALALTKLEVWWYLLMRLGPQLPANFEQVCVPLIQSTLSLDSSPVLQGTPSRVPANQSLAMATPVQKSGPHPFASPVTPRMNFNPGTPGSVAITSIPSIRLLGIEMLLHFLMGPEVLDFAKQNKLVLSLEPLQFPLISSPSFFCKHASTFINAVQDGFTAIGKEVPDCMLNVIWKDINGYVKTAIESGSKEKQGSETLTVLLQALKNIVRSNSLPVQKILSLIDITVKELPPKVLGSPAYQVADMDLLNGTPALFLIQLPFHNNLLECCVTDERFFVILETLVGYVLSGPTSPLAFSESVICVINESAKQVANKEHLWRMWSIVVNPLTEWINRTNEVNQGDALEHNFSAVYSALLLPVSHIFPDEEFPQPTMKSLLRTWSELYRTFARCAALVATAEENLCCEELCAKIVSGLEGETPVMFSMLDGLTHILSVTVDCINFAPYTTKHQPKNRSPQTSTDWSKKKEEPLGKLASLFKLLVMLLNSFHVFSCKEICSETLVSVGPSVLAILHTILNHVSLPSVIGSMLAMFAKPLAVFYEKTKLADVPKVYSHLNNKLEKLLAEIILCLQSHCTGSYDSELLKQLSPLLCVVFQHKSKQIRNQCAHFWNATFAKTASLTYPEELKSVLSQAKKNIPLLLPGFESIEIAEDSSSPFSDVMENSQLDAKISGMEVKLGQKRDSLLAQMSDLNTEVKDEPSNVEVTPAKLKLEFPSSKIRSEILLEEEKSIDFVFIPPETKPRILTEHQKEVLRSKRVGIPAMYNNLDTSQDTTLFSQYSQSQEDTLEKASLLENAEEDKKCKPQEEDVKREECTNESDEVREACRSASLPESTVCERMSPVTCVEESEGDSEQCTAQMIQDEPSAEERLERSTVETASKEPSAANENTSNVSSSSTSSDVISGTPQPASRRQSFITLEKFGSSEKRPFSLSPLNSLAEVSGSASVAGKWESKPEKPEDDKKPSKSESEQTFPAVRRVTRRQAKIEQQGHKQSKLLMRTEPESLASSSTENSPGLCSIEEMEQVLLSHSQALCSTDTIIKKAEDAIAELERDRAVDTDSKENTPPETTVSSEQVAGDDSCQVLSVSPNQKTVRRSSRRRLETTEGTAGSQDTEDGHQKRGRHKEDEKSGQKKVPQTKDDVSQKQKAASGKTTENTIKTESDLTERTVAEESSSEDSPASRGLDEEVNKSVGRPEDSLKADPGNQDCSLSAVEQRVERPRYYTRRASQGLLSSIENSEADGSETKEESTSKRKCVKWRNRSDSLEGKLKDPGSHGHEVSSQGSETQNLLEANQGELSCEVSRDGALTAEPCDLENKIIPTDTSIGVGPASSETSPDMQNTSVEQSESTMLVEALTSPCVPDQDLKAAEENRHAQKQTTIEGSCSNASGGDLSSLKKPKPQQRRGKRLKRLKDCGCCAKKTKQQVKSFSRSENEITYEGSKPQTTPVKTAVNKSELSGSSPLDESVPVVPCAMSTPVHPPKEPSACKWEKERPAGEDLQGKSDVGEVDLQDPECIAGEVTVSVVEMAEPADQTEQSLSEYISDKPGDSDQDKEPGAVEEQEISQNRYLETEEPAEENEQTEQCLSEPGDSVLAAGNQSEVLAATEQEEVSQERQLEEISEALAVVSKPEQKEMNELESNQDDKEEAESTGGETCITQDKVMEELVQMEVTVPEDTALDEEEAVENTSVESPQKPEDGNSLVTESPNGLQARCTWSPLASPSTSILKRGLKRNQEDDSLSPANKIRRVSFANPIYQESLADDIDRRNPVIKSHSPPSSRGLRTLSNAQTKRITTPTKGFLSPGSRNPIFKSSKKCLIAEMVKESLPSPTECMYPALAGCKAPIDVILPQITSSFSARGLGQLVLAKNIKTVGDLSNLTASEINSLPVRAPKVSIVKKALKGYHEQQVKSRGLEEIAALEDADKPLDTAEEKPFPVDEEKLATDLVDPVDVTTSDQATNTDDQPSADLLSQINAVAAQLTSEALHGYSGSQLFEMQEKLVSMTNCILKNLQSRWRSPPHESSG